MKTQGFLIMKTQGFLIRLPYYHLKNHLRTRKRLRMLGQAPSRNARPRTTSELRGRASGISRALKNGWRCAGWVQGLLPGTTVDGINPALPIIRTLL